MFACFVVRRIYCYGKMSTLKMILFCIL